MPWLIVMLLGIGAAAVGHWLEKEREKAKPSTLPGPGGKVIPMGALRDQAKALADRWSVVFQVPANWIMAIMDLESAFNPAAKNLTERALKLGGAWGLMMVTEDTAKGIARELSTSSNLDVQNTLKKWQGKGSDLLDAELGSMFGAYYLSKLYREFKTFDLTSAAYQQGPGAIREDLKRGKRIPEDLPPHGKEYVTLASGRLARYT